MHTQHLTISLPEEEKFTNKAWFGINGQSRIYKLHGSLDYRYKEYDPNLRIVRDYIHRLYNDIYHYEVYEGNYDFNLGLPAIVAPSPFKILPQSIVYLWSIAGFILSNADEIVFLGYSLPDNDTHARALFQSCIYQNCNKKLSKNEKLKVLTVDSNIKSSKRIEKLIEYSFIESKTVNYEFIQKDIKEWIIDNY